ncbi:MAG: alpha/beta hydrolase-fold protein [Saprospiraceae bacterium]
MTENKAKFQTNRKEGTLSLIVTTKVDDDRPVFIAGNFNNWQLPDEKYRLEKIKKGQYAFHFTDVSALPPLLEYKYAKENWDGRELDQDGEDGPNRRLLSDCRYKEEFIPGWRKDGLSYNPAFLPNIHIISEAFEIPQLIRTRRISAILPYNYQEETKRYPVLYLQDGQNLFDDYAPFGNWAIDKKLAILSEQGIGDLIVIAIDHAEEDRVKEFTPSSGGSLGKGEGKKYVRFLADTLKPHVDKHFRTLSGRNSTGIGGSSMGGLISVYAGLMYPEVFGRLLIFSPSLWAAPNIHFHAINFHEAHDSRVYIYAGERESKTMVPNINKFKTALEQQGSGANIEFNISIDPQGQHNEARWGKEFPKAVEWLYFNKSGEE